MHPFGAASSVSLRGHCPVQYFPHRSHPNSQELRNAHGLHHVAKARESASSPASNHGQPR
jgi:hypothetical protein